MSKVIQIRDVPDEVHAALFRAAEEQGTSLTGYLNAELAHLARRSAMAAHNAEVVRRTRSRVRGQLRRDAILSAVREERGEE